MKVDSVLKRKEMRRLHGQGEERNAGNLQNFGMTGKAFHEIPSLSQNFYLQLKVHLWNPFDPFLRSLPRSKTICDGADRFWIGLKF